jgi:hypothetical protein
MIAIAAFGSSAGQAQQSPCFWNGRLFTCNQAEQGQANTDVYVAHAATGPASAFIPDFSPHSLSDYGRGVHDAMVSHNLEHLTPEALSVSTEVASFGSHHVFKTRIFAPSQMFMYQFAGVSGSNMVVVGCISRTARPFQTGGTECDRQAAKAFGD